MPTLPANGANLFDVAISNAVIPPEGPKAMAVLADFSASASFDINLLLTQSQQFMTAVQAVFIDNADNGSPVTIKSSVINQRLICPPNSQGYFPLMVAKNGTLSVSSSGAVKVAFIFLNVPVPAAVWSAV